MIKKIDIRGFRCFENFTMNEVKPITIIGGRNNVGKTSLLEAILFPKVFKRSEVFLHLSNLRDIRNVSALSPVQFWNPLFYGINDTKKFSIKVYSNCEATTELTIEKKYDEGLLFHNKDSFPQELEAHKKFSALKIELKIEERTVDGEFTLDKDLNTNSTMLNFKLGKKSVDFKIPYSLEKIILYSSKTRYDVNVPEAVSKINLSRIKKNLLLSTLQKFDKTIVDVNTVIENGIPYVFVTLESEKVMPINYMGDGINKFMEILVCIINLPNGILLIDEIENGLYYALYEEMLTVLCQTALDINCQLIMTTHNRDIIEALRDSMENLGHSDKLCYQRLGFSRGKHKTYPFFGESLNTAFDLNIEMR